MLPVCVLGCWQPPRAGVSLAPRVGLRRLPKEGIDNSFARRTRSMFVVAAPLALAFLVHAPPPLSRGTHAAHFRRGADAKCSVEGSTFCRASDLLSTGDAVSARAIVNVIGRWQASTEWDSIGVAKTLDEVLAGERTDYPEGGSVEASPRRREFCKRQGVVQRFILNSTVGLLPFENEALAASVGATARELNAEPIDPRAVDVCFDALSASQSGIINREECDERRAGFETADGAFDDVAFADALSTARRNIVLSYALYPGLPNAIFLFLAWRLDAFSGALESADDVLGVVQQNWETMGVGSLLLPLLPLGLIAYGAANPPSSSKAAGEARAADRLFVKEKVRQRQLADEQATLDAFKEARDEAAAATATPTTEEAAEKPLV